MVPRRRSHAELQVWRSARQYSHHIFSSAKDGRRRCCSLLRGHMARCAARRVAALPTIKRRHGRRPRRRRIGATGLLVHEPQREHFTAAPWHGGSAVLRPRHHPLPSFGLGSSPPPITLPRPRPPSPRCYHPRLRRVPREGGMSLERSLAARTAARARARVLASRPTAFHAVINYVSTPSYLDTACKRARRNSAQGYSLRQQPRRPCYRSNGACQVADQRAASRHLAAHLHIINASGYAGAATRIRRRHNRHRRRRLPRSSSPPPAPPPPSPPPAPPPAPPPPRLLPRRRPHRPHLLPRRHPRLGRADRNPDGPRDAAEVTTSAVSSAHRRS